MPRSIVRSALAPARQRALAQDRANVAQANSGEADSFQLVGHDQLKANLRFVAGQKVDAQVTSEVEILGNQTTLGEPVYAVTPVTTTPTEHGADNRFTVVMDVPGRAVVDFKVHAVMEGLQKVIAGALLEKLQSSGGDASTSGAAGRASRRTRAFNDPGAGLGKLGAASGPRASASSAVERSATVAIDAKYAASGTVEAHAQSIAVAGEAGQASPVPAKAPAPPKRATVASKKPAKPAAPEAAAAALVPADRASAIRPPWLRSTAIFFNALQARITAAINALEALAARNRARLGRLWGHLAGPRAQA